MRNEIRREQVKLRAAYYNGIAIALTAVGGLGFAFSFFREHPDWRGIVAGFVMLIVCSIGSITIREIGVKSLADLPMD